MKKSPRSGDILTYAVTQWRSCANWRTPFLRCLRSCTGTWTRPGPAPSQLWRQGALEAQEAQEELLPRLPASLLGETPQSSRSGPTAGRWAMTSVCTWTRWSGPGSPPRTRRPGARSSAAGPGLRAGSRTVCVSARGTRPSAGAASGPQPRSEDTQVGSSPRPEAPAPAAAAGRAPSPASRTGAPGTRRRPGRPGAASGRGGGGWGPGVCHQVCGSQSVRPCCSHHAPRPTHTWLVPSRTVGNTRCVLLKGSLDEG